MGGSIPGRMPRRGLGSRLRPGAARGPGRDLMALRIDGLVSLHGMVCAGFAGVRPSAPRERSTAGITLRGAVPMPAETATAARSPGRAAPEPYEPNNDAGGLADMATNPETQTRSTRQSKALHLTPAERAAVGKAARAQVPRSSQAVFAPAQNRPDPVALLEAQAATRVPELVPIRYGRMLVSPFTFYRGAALIMASDLAATPTSGLRVQACGDAHLSNFGVFASPERELVFDINDFDETTPGPWEWDVKRLLASLEVAGRSNGYSAAERRGVLLAGANRYRTAMAQFAAMRNLDLWYAHADLDNMMRILRGSKDTWAAKRTKKSAAKARTRDSMQALEKFTAIIDGRRRIVSQPPLIVRLDELAAESGYDGRDLDEEMRAIVRGYRDTLQTDRRHLLEEFEFVDAARKVVGVGSVGTRAWMALFVGRDGGDPLFLQVKEAQSSVLEAYTGVSEYANAGQRVVAGQRLMQSSSDIFLGWHRIKGLDGVERDFYLRQLRDWKGSAEVDAMPPAALSTYARLCAWTLAKAHARSGDRIAIAAYLGNSDVFDHAVADFAAAYADQNEKDYAALQDAAGTGRVTAKSGL